MNKVWTEFAPAARAQAVHSEDMPGRYFIPRKYRSNSLIEQANPELSRSRGAPVSY
jgi:hypothetical protein